MSLKREIVASIDAQEINIEGKLGISESGYIGCFYLRICTTIISTESIVAKAESACQNDCNFRPSPEAALQAVGTMGVAAGCCWLLLCLSFTVEGWFHGLVVVSLSLILYYLISSIALPLCLTRVTSAPTLHPRTDSSTYLVPSQVAQALRASLSPKYLTFERVCINVRSKSPCYQPPQLVPSTSLPSLQPVFSFNYYSSSPTIRSSSVHRQVIVID